MKCVFLCRRLAGYFHSSLTYLADTHAEIEITVVAYPNTANAPFSFQEHPRISISNRNDYAEGDLVRLFEGESVDYIYSAGWADKEYRKVCGMYKNSIPVVLGMDNQWKGRWKQYLLSYGMRHFLHGHYNKIWVPGLYQYEYARKLGFTRENILTGLYSADTEKFKMTSRPMVELEEKCLLFIGNMWEDKGVVEMVEAFVQLHEDYQDWKLLLVGGGPLVEVYQDKWPFVEVLGFQQPSELAKVLERATAFCLPSYHDAWGVVIHEAACMGLPIVATDVCGAVSAFVHEGYNGFLCAPKNKQSLELSFRKLMSLSAAQLQSFADASIGLSKQISPSLWASKVTHLLATDASA